MIGQNTEFQSRLRVARLYGDAEILLSIYNSKIWKSIFGGEDITIWILFKELLLFKVELFAYSVRLFLRIKPGKRTIGFTVWLFMIFTLIAFNSVHLLIFLAPFTLFLSPIIYFYVAPFEPQTLALVDIQSSNLLAFSIVSIVWSFIQIMLMYGGWRNKGDATKRGDSILHLVLPKQIKVKEELLQTWIEPCLVFSLAYYFLAYKGDVVFCSFLCLAALCLFSQELLDTAYRTKFERQ